MIEMIIERLDQILSYCNDSLFFLFLHSLWIPYSFLKISLAHPQSTAAKLVKENNTFKLLLINCTLALGGGSLSNILTGIPVAWLNNNHILPAYICGYFVVQKIPVVYRLLNLFSSVSDVFLDCVVDGVARAVTIPVYIKNVRNGVSKDAYFAQFVLGILSVTGGGIIFNMSFQDFEVSSDIWIVAAGSLAYLTGLDPKIKALVSFVFQFTGIPLIFQKILPESTFFKDGWYGEREGRVFSALVIVFGFLIRFEEIGVMRRKEVDVVVSKSKKDE